MKIIRPIDFYFAEFIAQKNNILMLVAACLSYEHSQGHIFLPIEYFEKKYFFSSANKKFTKKILNILKNEINWLDELLKHPSVSNGAIITPLIVYKKKIYLYKMWKSESKIFTILNKNNKINQINYTQSFQILSNLFPEKYKNFQKIAVALTLINNITFIIGGPGTGKTTIISKIIIALIKTTQKSIKIALSAPTGKATTRLTEMMQDSIFNIFLSLKEQNYLPSNATTIHQLLGIEKKSQKSIFNKNHLLDLDVLIIDETSMIDILIMEKIFDAVSENTKLIFIGDQNQLRPVESGSILKIICSHSHNGYSSRIISQIEKITSYNLLDKKNQKNTCHINDKICILNKNYRFNKNSGIYMLSNAICDKKIEICKDLFKNIIKNVFFYENNSILQYKKMIENIVSNYKNFWKKINQQDNIKEIIKSFQDYQTLCVLNEGLFGVKILNKKIEESMYEKKIIKYIYINDQVWYIGKPIIITHNNKNLDVFNGNIGITNLNKNGILQVSFLQKKDIIKNIPVNILRKYNTAWVITVHKAQGSEFIETSLVLPNFNSNILNKDVVYTGVTRSQKKLTIFSQKELFIKAILKNKYEAVI